MSDLKAPTAASFFLYGSGSLSSSLFQWLSFHRFVHTEQILELDENKRPEGLNEWLAIWRSQQAKSLQAPDGSIVFWIAAIMGVIAMSGLLAVGLGSPINLWLPLFLFAFLPLLMSLVTSTQLWRADTAPVTRKFGLLLKLLKLERHRDLLTESPRLMWPWLNWQLQRAACVFMVFALLTFFLVATFQELNFVWSSTFIQSSASMAQILSVIATPWSWMLPAPTPELVEAARFDALGLAGERTSYQSSQLWPFVIASMLFYGLMPRVALLILFRRQLKKRLTDSVEQSGTIEVFLNRQLQQVSQQALDVEESDAGIEHLAARVSESTSSLLGWRLSAGDAESRGLARNLGLDDWQVEAEWLASDAAVMPNPVRMMVGFWQTPTGELEDCLQQIKAKNPQTELVLMEAPAAFTGSGTVGMAGDREQAQLSSWRYFAEKVTLPLVIEETL